MPNLSFGQEKRISPEQLSRGRVRGWKRLCVHTVEHVVDGDVERIYISFLF
jgi:hypothetical protein